MQIFVHRGVAGGKSLRKYPLGGPGRPGPVREEGSLLCWPGHRAVVGLTSLLGTGLRRSGEGFSWAPAPFLPWKGRPTCGLSFLLPQIMCWWGRGAGRDHTCWDARKSGVSLLDRKELQSRRECSSVRAAIIKCHGLGGLNSRHLFSQSSEG